MLNDLSIRLKNYFEKLHSKSITRSECAELINLSKKIIIPYLLNTKSHFLKLSNQHGLDVNDLAVDVVAEVFRQDCNGNFITLNNFISKLYNGLENTTDGEILIAYQSFLRKNANIQIARIYAELDPGGFKIQRNIKDALPTKNLGLRKNIIGNMIYVLNSEKYDYLPYLHFEEIEKEFLSRISENLSTKELLEIIYSILSEQEYFRKEINLTDAVILFKKYYKIEQTLFQENELDLVPAESFFDKYELDNIFDEIIKKIKSKIFIDYFSKGKLTLEQSKSVACAVNDIAYDLIFIGHNHTSYYDYLSKYLTVDQNEYDLKFESKLEYLIKLVRQDIKNYLYTKE